MKIKTTILLIVALVFAPLRTPSQETIPPKKDNIFVACAVLAVGAIIVYGIWKICKMIPPAGGTKPPPAGGTNNLPHSSNGLLASPLRLNLPDMPIGMSTNWQTAVMAFQSSTNMIDWQNEYTITNWFGGDQIVSICYSNQISLITNILAMHWTNETVFLDLSSVMPSANQGKSKLWRAVEY